MMALVAIGYMWAQMAKLAREKLDNGAENGGLENGGAGKTFYETKLVTGRFFMERMLPDVNALAAKIAAGGASMMALDAAAF